MPNSKGPIYESTFYVDAHRAEEFDGWLAAHCEQAEDSRFVVACRSFPIANDADGHIGRACQYTLTDDDAVGPFLDGPGTDVEAELKLNSMCCSAAACCARTTATTPHPETLPIA